MSTSGQFLTVPSLSHRSSHHHRRDSARAAAQSPRTQHPAAASSSKVMLEDTPLGMPSSPSPPPTAAVADTATTSNTSSSSFPRVSPMTPVRRQTLPAPLTTSIAAPGTSNNTPPSPAGAQSQSSQQLSPRSIFRAMPFLLRLRSPPSDLLSLTCTSGGPRTHAVLRKCQIDKASQTLTYDKTLVCADAVNAEVLLRLARNELLERAQQANRSVTALVDEEWQYTIRQTKNGDYNVQMSYSACPARCDSQNSNMAVDPRKPVALSHITNIPGLMRVVHSD